MSLTLSATPAALATPADEAAVKTIVESVAVFADRGAFEALERLYADEVLVDYSSLSGEPAKLTSPGALMTEWASVLPGFDRTYHDLSNVAAEIDGDTARASASVAASHWIGDAYWRVNGRYAYELARSDGEWRVTSMTLLVEDEEGSRDVFGPAMAAAAEAPPAYIQRQQTKAAVLDFLTGLEEKDMGKVNGVWAEDAVQEMPYTPSNFPSRVVGKDALIAHYAAWPETSGTAAFTDDLVFHPMTDPQMVFAEYRGAVDAIPTGKTYRQTYGGLFHVENGKITLFREYFDPRAFAEAFGMEQ